MKRSTAIIILFIIVLGALCLRLFNLFTYDLWFDEVITNKFSSDNLKSMAHANNTSPLGYFFANTIKDPHSTLFYTVVYGYSFLFGGGKALRILSVFFSICSLGIFYKTARIFFNRHKSLFACFLMAVSPFHIWYAQEVRGYTMACFFTLLLVYFYMRALGTNRILYWAAFTIASIIALYASYYVAFLLIGLGIIVLFHYDRRCIGRWHHLSP